ncbi:MAG: hypothetical protein JW904_02320 [Spirochaetales bacterium]|nr:hypothetical protein [Spirochaetales bacterium]
MKTKRIIQLLVAGGILVLAGVILFFLVVLLTPPTLEVTIVDEYAGTAIWDSSVSFQNRYHNGYFNKTFNFTNIATGDFELVVTAPNYQEQRVMIPVLPGPNVYAEPIKMKAIAIPEFYQFYIENNADATGVAVIFVPINKAGDFIKPFPGVNVVPAIRISEQWKDGVPVVKSETSGSVRGPELYSGVPSWQAADVEGAFFKYLIEVKPDEIKNSAAAYYVVDCLVLLPDWKKVTMQQVTQILEGIKGIDDPKDLSEYLSKYEPDVKYTYKVLWNVANVLQKSAPVEISQGGVK